MIIFRIFHVFSLAFILFAFQDAARAFDEPSNQGESPEPQDPDDVGPTVDDIHRRLFEPDDNTILTVDQVKDLIIEAIALLRSPANRYEPSTPEDSPALVHLFDLFSIVVEDHDIHFCDHGKLVRVRLLESAFADNQNLASFLKHFNVRRFEVCSSELILEMNSTQQLPEEFTGQELHHSERFHHLNTLSELVARRRNELIEAGEYPIDDDSEEEDSSLRNTSVSIMRYLAEYLEIDIEKPVDRRMDDQLTLIGRFLDNIFYRECEDLGSMHGQYYTRYQFYIHHYRQELRHSFWENELVANLLDKLTICHQLAYANTDIYLLGHYDIDELISRIEDTDVGVTSPEEMVDLLEIALFLSPDYAPMAKSYIDLLVPNQISTQKCDANYLRLLKENINWLADETNLEGYLSHYGRLHVLECLPQFDAILQNLAHEIEVEQVLDLASLCNIFRDVARQVEPSLRLYYDTIPNTIIRLSGDKIFDAFGFNLSTLLESDLERLPMEEDKIRNLIDTCRPVIDNLAPAVAMFRSFIELDGDVTSRMNGDQLDLMSQYNICKTLVELSDGPTTLPIGNLTI